MCVHYWVIDSLNNGICKRCGGVKDFSSPPIKMTKQEKREIKYPFNHDFYMQGRVWLDELDVQ